MSSSLHQLTHRHTDTQAPYKDCNLSTERSANNNNYNAFLARGVRCVRRKSTPSICQCKSVTHVTGDSQRQQAQGTDTCDWGEGETVITRCLVTLRKMPPTTRQHKQGQAGFLPIQLVLACIASGHALDSIAGLVHCHTTPLHITQQTLISHINPVIVCDGAPQTCLIQ